MNASIKSLFLYEDLYMRANLKLWHNLVLITARKDRGKLKCHEIYICKEGKNTSMHIHYIIKKILYKIYIYFILKNSIGKSKFNPLMLYEGGCCTLRNKDVIAC